MSYMTQTRLSDVSHHHDLIPATNSNKYSTLHQLFLKYCSYSYICTNYSSIVPISVCSLFLSLSLHLQDYDWRQYASDLGNDFTQSDMSLRTRLATAPLTDTARSNSSEMGSTSGSMVGS